MSGPKRNPDKLNTIGVVVVGVCGAVLVYVTIVALEAFYVNDTSDIQTMADYGGNEIDQAKLRAEQQKNIEDQGNTPNGVAANLPQSYRIPIEKAMKLVVSDANKPNADFTRLAGTALPPASMQPKTTPPPTGAGSAAPTTPPPAGTGSAAPTTPPAGAGSAAPTGTGSAAQPHAVTGSPTEPAPVAGTGGAPVRAGSAGSAAGGHAP